MSASFQILELPTKSDERGSLTVLEDALPFPIRRLYWIHGADGRVRGGHRHFETRQALTAVAGVVTVLMDDGVNSRSIILDRPSQVLIVEPSHWHQMSFAPGAVLLVVASHPYDANDYIHEPYTKAE